MMRIVTVFSALFPFLAMANAESGRSVALHDMCSRAGAQFAASGK